MPLDRAFSSNHVAICSSLAAIWNALHLTEVPEVYLISHATQVSK